MYKTRFKEDDNVVEDGENDLNMATSRQLYRMMTLGFHHGPNHMKKYIYCQFLAGLLIVLMWIRFNGGVLPWFLASREELMDLPSVHLLDFFRAAQYDGAKITWAHAVNSGDALSETRSSNIMMLEGDIMLRGQGTAEQEMVPIMAHPPAVTSDITFETWLKASMHTGKGLKLDFKSIEAVEITLQTLGQFKGKLHVPIWLNADVLTGPNIDPGEQKPVDATRFLRLCTEEFQTSTLSLGWTTSAPKAYSENRYDWAMVKAMHDLVDKWQLKQPLTFPVRASMVRQSLPMLRWLLEMTGGTLTIWDGGESFPVEDLMVLRRKLPITKVFYDLSKKVGLEFAALQEQQMDQFIEGRQTDLTDGVFNSDKWTIVRSDTGQTLYMGTNAVLLQRAFLVSKAKYDTKPGQKLVIIGKLEFIDLPQDEPENPNDVHLDLFLHVTQGSHPGAISGFRITINSNGKLVITTQSVPGVDKTATEDTGQDFTCLDFEIEEIPNSSLTLKVSQFCRPGISLSNRTWHEVSLDLKELEVDGSQMALRMNSDQGLAAMYNTTIQVQDLML